MKRRVKRYAEGEMVEGDEVPMDMEPRRSIKDYMTNPAKETEGGYTSPEKEYEAEPKAPAKKRKRKQKYADVVKASELGSQDFSSKPSAEKKEGAPGYAGPAALAGASAAAAAAKAAMKKSPPPSPRVEPTLSSSKGSAKGMPGSSLKDPYAMQLGSDLDVKRSVKRGMKRMGEDSSGIEFNKGGKVSSASSRADGVAQRGKTRGKIC